MSYETCVVFPQYPWIFAGVPKTDEKEAKINEVLGFLDIYLGSYAWAAGDSITVADISLAATISTFEVFHDWTFSR
jgi:glutathione S-transferase